MPSRTSSIIGWTSALLIALFNIFAAVMKFVPVAPGSPTDLFMKQLGISVGLDHVLGVLEFAVVLLFLIPRTSTVGVVLMAGYLGGALATNITHGFTVMDALPLYIGLALLAISGWCRNPELTARLFGRPVSSQA